MEADCCIELLGGVRIRVTAQPAVPLPVRKPTWLLAYLALHRRQTHSRERLIELLWPDLDFASGRDNLSTALSALRRQLSLAGIGHATILRTDRQTVALRSEAVATDLERFQALLQEAAGVTAPGPRAACLERAVALCQGELLPGCFEPWAIEARRRHSEQCGDAWLRRSAALEEIGDREGALAAARGAAQVDPLREEACRAELRLLAVLGRVPEALDRYRVLEDFMSAELGEMPSRATRDLAAELEHRLKAPGSAAPPSAHTVAPRRAAPLSRSVLGSGRAVLAGSALPQPLTRFFGREAESARLYELLGGCARKCPARLVSLIGPGGIGKTRLAVEVARRLSPVFARRVWFVDLSPVANVHQALSALVTTLQLPPLPDRDAFEQMADVLEDKPCLLVLDNFEHLLREADAPEPPAATTDDGAALVSRLLEQVPRLVCLVTSRQPLRRTGEQEFPLGPLPIPTQDPRSTINLGTDLWVIASPSVQLFVDRARLVDPHFVLKDEEAQAVVEICRALDGIPLALEMAAAWARTLPPVRMRERLPHQLDLLTTRRQDVPPRHRSLRATIEWSYGLLSPALQRLFLRLSTFRGGWSLEGAEAVCSDGGTPADLLAGLTELAEKSLLLVEAGADGARYRMLGPLREWAAERLAQRGEGDVLARRHAGYFAALVEGMPAACSGPQQEAWLRRCDRERENLRAAVSWGLDRQPELALRIAGALWQYWDRRGLVSEGLHVLESALATATEAPAAVRASALRGAGHLAWCRADYERAKGFLRSALALLRAEEATADVAAALTSLGQIAAEEGDLVAAHASLTESLALRRKIADEWGIARSLTCLGMLARMQSDYALARRFLDEALARYQRLQSGWGEATTLNQQGLLARTVGDYPWPAAASRRAWPSAARSMTCEERERPWERWPISTWPRGRMMPHAGSTRRRLS